MANRQIEQAKVDIDAALLLIQGGDLEPAVPLRGQPGPIPHLG